MASTSVQQSRGPESASDNGSGDFRPVRLVTWGLGIGALGFLVGLLAVAYMGTHMRLSGDDYCFGSVVAEQGFVRAQAYSYLGQPPYHGDRFAATFVAGLIILAGPGAWAAWTGWSVFFWVGAATSSLWMLAKSQDLPQPLLSAATCALAVVFLTIYQAPDRVQSVYWWSANVLYLLPLPAAWLAAGLILLRAEAQRAKVFLWVLIALTVFLAGGLSEASAAFQASWILLALGYTLFWTRRPTWDRREVVVGLLAAVVGSGASFLVLGASPYVARNLERLGEHPGMASLLASSMTAGTSFLRETLEGLPLPTIVTIGFGGIVGLYSSFNHRDRRPGSWLKTASAIAAVTGGAIVLAAAVQAPSLYAYRALPDARALILARHGLVLALAGVGANLGVQVGAGIPAGPSRRMTTSLLLLAGLAMVSLYAIRGGARVTADSRFYRRWASAWDARHASILDAREGGQVDLHVVQIDHIIPSVSELTPDPGYWYNQCAAGYYGVGSITADLPGWDE